MEPFIGEIKLFAGDFAPRGWFFCDGTLLDPNRYTALFTLLQTTYGGDGGSTFALPDLRGRAPIQRGQGKTGSNYDLGQVAGNETVTLTPAQLPAHSHAVNAVSTTGTSLVPTLGFLSAAPGDPLTGAGATIYSEDQTLKADVTLNANTIAPTGGGQTVNIVSPVLALNYIIAWDGVFPSRP